MALLLLAITSASLVSASAASATESASKEIVAGGYPASLSRDFSYGQELRFSVSGNNSFRCETAPLTATLPQQSTDLTVNAQAGQKCRDWQGTSTELQLNGCSFSFNAPNGTFGIGGTGCTAMTISFVNCGYRIPAQAGVPATLSDDGHELTLGPGHALTVEVWGSNCTANPGKYTTGSFEGTWTLQGKNAAGEGVDVRVSGRSAITGEANEVEASSANLHGEIDTHGAESIYTMAYGLTSEYESSSGGKIVPGSGSSQKVSALVQGLKPDTTYHYATVIANKFGTFYGADLTFHTPRAQGTLDATEVAAGSARLNGFVNPIGSETAYQFEYGTSTSYGTSVPVPAKSLGTGIKALNVSELVTGLEPNTTYHYRIVATRGGEPHYGVDKVFDTFPHFNTELAPATVRGKQVRPSTPFRFTFGSGGVLKCTEARLEGAMNGTASATVSVTPNLSGCEFLGLTPTISTGGCALVIHAGSSLDVAGANCAAEPIVISVPGCKITVGPQAGLSGIAYQNMGSGTKRFVAADVNAAGASYSLSGVLCGRQGSFGDGALMGAFQSLEGINAATLEAEGIWVEGAEFHVEKAQAIVRASLARKAENARFSFAGASMTCTEPSLKGTMSTTGSQTVVLTPTLGGCQFLGSTPTISTGGCAFVLHVNGSLDVGGANCAAEPIVISVPGCKITVGPQAGLSQIGFHNFGTGSQRYVWAEFNNPGMQYMSTGIICPKSGTFADGTFTATIQSLEAADPSQPFLQQGFWVDL